MEQRAFEFIAAWPTDKQPFKVRGDELSIVLDLPRGELEKVIALYRAGEGRDLHILVDVQDARTFGKKA